MGIFTTKIDEALVMLNEAEQAERMARRMERIQESGGASKPNFSPSMISKCSREIVYNMLHLPVIPVIDPRILRIFDNGNSTHERLLKYLGASGVLWKYEMLVEDQENRIRGYIDAVAKLDEENYVRHMGPLDTPGAPYVLGEFKSANINSFRWIELRNEPAKKYVQQLQLYMHITGVHKGIVLVERKDDQYLLEFPVDYDAELVTELLGKVRYCLDFADRRALPPRESTRRGKFCWSSSDKRPRCGYYDICWSETEGMDLIDMGPEVNEELLELAVGDEEDE